MPLKPMRMFVYQPNYTVDGEGKNKEYLNTKTYNNMTYFPVRKGDIFTTEKRVREITEMQNDTTSKVVKVSYNLSDGSCNVILAEKVTVRKPNPALPIYAKEPIEENELIEKEQPVVLTEV